MCSAPNVYMFVYILIGTHMVPLKGEQQGPDNQYKLLFPLFINWIHGISGTLWFK